MGKNWSSYHLLLKVVGTGNWCGKKANSRQQKRPKCLDKKPNGVFRAKECSRGLLRGRREWGEPTRPGRT